MATGTESPCFIGVVINDGILLKMHFVLFENDDKFVHAAILHACTQNFGNFSLLTGPFSILQAIYIHLLAYVFGPPTHIDPS